jgi:transposase
MKDYRLSKQEIAELRSAHRSTRHGREAYRLNAVILLGSGWSPPAVADALLIDADSVRNYFKHYKEGGVDKLLRMNYVGSEALLSPAELAVLDRHLQAHLYLSAEAVARWVEAQWGVHYTPSGMAALLHRLGYVYKKPKLVPGQGDPDEQRAFLAREQARKEAAGAPVPTYYMDAVHPQHNPVLGCGWIKRGKRFQIPSNTGRRRLNINGAINVTTLDGAFRFDETINAASTLALLRQIEAANPAAAMIEVYCDNARYYYAKAVQEYLKGSRIRLIFLPPYSPNLNVIERLWKFFKRQVLYNRYYEHFHEFSAACRKFFDELGSYADQLRTLLTENFEIVGG